MSAAGKYDGVQGVTALQMGVFELYRFADLVVRFDSLPSGCQLAIRMQEEGGAKYFAVTTKVFRGDITAKVKISSTLGAEAKQR